MNPNLQNADDGGGRNALLQALNGAVSRGALRPRSEQRPLAPRAPAEPDLHANLRDTIAAKFTQIGEFVDEF